jgi:predicted XRE-type DNA-binding protein
LTSSLLRLAAENDIEMAVSDPIIAEVIGVPREKARQMTQAKFAEALGVNQGEIFKIEHRSEIRAIFPIVRWRISQFEELNSPAQVV